MWHNVVNHYANQKGIYPYPISDVAETFGSLIPFTCKILIFILLGEILTVQKQVLLHMSINMPKRQ
ncbi:MAG: hypothetical protein B6D64_05285 [Bacteroidetes bacterium 4484_276]|nr:MAG: hypothetical protein B6D64_05285 [Bacteroidetes bacterium 4484_276]OYT13576.1 MAG: hypothetical protein B6I19_04400 [Bacteroidetes bacterium 4572_114]